LKLVKPRCHLDFRKYSFAHRVINIWNSLDDSIIACDSINGFKGRIDQLLYVRARVYRSLSSFLPSQILYYTIGTPGHHALNWDCPGQTGYARVGWGR